LRPVIFVSFLVLAASGLFAADPAYLVKDINQNLAPYGSYPDQLLTVGNITYFNTTQANNPVELWRTDGTAAGTIYLGRGGWWKSVWAGKLWFLTAVYPGGELWSTDGTPGGTVKLDLPAGVAPTALMPGGNHLYFLNQGNLWRTDGVPGTTVKVSDTLFGELAPAPDGSPISAVAGGSCYFLSRIGVQYFQLWKVDDGGLTAITNFVPGDGGWAPIAVGPLVYFFKLRAGSPSSELWRTDGTAAGTFKVALVGGWASTRLMVNGSQVSFQADDGSGWKFWRTDGTLAGTMPISTNLPGTLGTLETLGQLSDGKILFMGDVSPPGLYRGLWVFDGTNITFLTNIDTSNGGGVGVAGSYLLLASGDGLYRSDGTAAGTLTLGILPGSQYQSWSMAALNGNVLFSANDSVHGAELWKSDGTVANTALLKDVDDTTYGSVPAVLRSLRGGVIFEASHSGTDSQPNLTDRDLWFSDGTSAGTVPVLTDAGALTELVSCGGRSYFARSTPSTGSELWASDGTAAGTGLVRDIYPGMTGDTANGSSPNRFVCVDDHVLFLARSTAAEWEIWRSDGTAAGTLKVKTLSFVSSLEFDVHTPFVRLGHNVYIGLRSFNHPQLWRSDGTPAGTTAIQDMVGYTAIYAMTASGNKLFYTVFKIGGQLELWSGDGTVAGTTKSFSDSSITLFTGFYGRVAFHWRSGSFSHGLCSTDGPSVPFCFDTSVAPGASVSMRPMNGRLYYSLPLLKETDGVTSALDDSGVGQMPALLGVAGGRLFATHTAFNGTYVTQETDGTVGGTQTILSRASTEAVSSGGRLFLTANEVYAYDLPVAALGLFPSSAEAAGGQTITITGRGFTAPATVTVGGIPATVTFVGGGTINFIAPPMAFGSHDVELTLGDGRRLSPDEPLRYNCTASSPSIAPLAGPVNPSTPVTLHGSGGTRCAWFPETGLDDAGSCNPVATVATSTTYALIVFSESGCPSAGNATVRVIVRPPAPGSITATGISSTSVNVQWPASAGAVQYEIGRMSATAPFQAVGTANSSPYVDNAPSSAAYLYRVRAISSEAAASDWSASDLATTFAFTDDPIIAGQTVVRRAHVQEMRAAVGAARALASLPSVNWTDTLTAQVTLIRAVHVLELRTALAEALNALGLPPPSFAASVAAGGVIHASDVQELRNALR
jgi:ELWxxDGT repeat protein